MPDTRLDQRRLADGYQPRLTHDQDDALARRIAGGRAPDGQNRVSAVRERQDAEFGQARTRPVLLRAGLSKFDR